MRAVGQQSQAAGCRLGASPERSRSIPEPLPAPRAALPGTARGQRSPFAARVMCPGPAQGTGDGAAPFRALQAGSDEFYQVAVL